MSTRTVRKALIPAAGRDTRFLPLTKSVPNELAPLVSTPALEFVVAEAADQGVTDVILVTSARKSSIMECFAPNEELEAALEKQGDSVGLASIRRAPELARISDVKQKSPRGLGDAVAHGEEFADGEALAVLLPDDLIDDRDHLLGAIIDTHVEHGGIVIGLIDVGGPVDVSKYGCVTLAAGTDPAADIVTVIGLVDKPPADQAPSTLAIIGRYVLPAEILAALRLIEPGAGGEIQLTDAMRRLAHDRVPVHGVVFRGRRYDTGDRLEYAKVLVQLAERHSEIGDDFTEWRREHVST